MDFSSVLGKGSLSGSFFFFFVMFFFILTFNFFSLFPFVFTCSGHLFFTLGLSLSVWSGIILFYLSFNLGGFISHLVASDSPLFLSPFIVCLELIRVIIRPLSLRVRLIANIVAGHLLLGLVGTFRLLYSGGYFIGLALTCLELGVCVVQSYVFSVLCLLYRMEIHCEQVSSFSFGRY
jgi:F-type H+-transporting ATPase subunit a